MRLHLNPEGSLFMAFGPRESRGRKVGAARERGKKKGGGNTWGKVRKGDGLVEDCEELVHLQRKCTRKGREYQEKGRLDTAITPPAEASGVSGAMPTVRKEEGVVLVRDSGRVVRSGRGVAG